MKIKKGVKLNGLGTEILLAIIIATSVYEAHGIELVITSATDSIHGYSSEHYKGDAVDIRTNTIKPETKKSFITAQIAEALGDEFDVVLESNHLHVEYDPK